MKVNKIPLCEFKLMSVLLATQHLDTRSTSYMKTEKQILKTSIDNTATTCQTCYIWVSYGYF